MSSMDICPGLPLGTGSPGSCQPLTALHLSSFSHPAFVHATVSHEIRLCCLLCHLPCSFQPHPYIHRTGPLRWHVDMGWHMGGTVGPAGVVVAVGAALTAFSGLPVPAASHEELQVPASSNQVQACPHLPASLSQPEAQGPVVGTAAALRAPRVVREFAWSLHQAPALLKVVVLQLDGKNTAAARVHPSGGCSRADCTAHPS
mmetsp:Transcript_62329/g.115687  ORF Transcript_62329/g.115687 Transcript_62329/m.115687 type:complete len:202 (+) Transcript_62329:166-771(+)